MYETKEWGVWICKSSLKKKKNVIDTNNFVDVTKVLKILKEICIEK